MYIYIYIYISLSLSLSLYMFRFPRPFEMGERDLRTGYVRGWRNNTVGKPHPVVFGLKEIVAGLDFLVCAWKTEGFGFI